VKRRLIIAFFIFIGLCFFFNNSPKALQFQQNSDDQFEIRKDGTVTIDGLTFKSLYDYVNSDYFKKTGKRCLIKGRYEREQIFASTSDCTLSQTNIQNEYWPSQIYTIQVVFHIIHKIDGTGNISDQRINDQLVVLNEDFRAIFGSLGEQGFDTKIQFSLAGITRTANDNWHNDNQEVQYKQALGWDQNTYLNVYVNSASGYLGYAYLPQNTAGDVRDGVVILYSSVGGRNNGFAQYDQGRTLVHEVGHYLGLLHTFDGYGCHEGYTAGDLIDDTPSESTEHYTCFQTYTCSTPDPIHNYLNYTDDDCMYEFTSEQANRAVCSLVNYRPQLFQITSPTPTITVTSPNGGESWIAGTSHNVTWTTTGTVGNVKLEYSSNNGSSWNTIVSSTANDGTYTWSVPNAVSSQCKVRISEASDGSPSDMSDSLFTIVSASQQYTISGSVNETIIARYIITQLGISGVVITFSNGGGTALTTANGEYSHTVNQGWSGTATPSKNGYIFSPSSRNYSNVTSNQTGQNYTATAVSPTISGTVETASGGGVSGVTLTFSNGGGIAATGANGIYSHAVVYGWSGTATPSKTSYTFTPSSLSYTNVITDLTDQDYRADVTGILNPGMEDGGIYPDHWATYNNDLDRGTGWIQGVAHSGDRSIKIINTTNKSAGWKGDTVTFSTPYPKGLTLGGWAKAEGVAAGGLFALDFRIGFEDGSYIWYFDDLRFNDGTHDWEKVERTVLFAKGVKSIRPYGLLYGATGTVWFDDLYANRH